MNKQELIGYYEKILDYGFLSVAEEKVYRGFVENLKQLDEPQKVVVPQFVADWIEEGRKHCKDVSDLFGFDFTNEEVGKWFLREKPFDLVARAWLDGYTVEKEKRYFVKMKGLSENDCYLRLGRNTNLWWFGMKYNDGSAEHTRKELEDAGFGWVFDCPGIEIEEVE